MSTQYIVTAPDGAVTKRTAKDGMTHAVIRKYADEMYYRVSLAGSEEKARKELKNRAVPQHALIVAMSVDGVADATGNTEYTNIILEEPAPAAVEKAVPGSSAAEIWARAFKAGQDYALQCAFQGVVAPPANPYE